MPYWTFDADTKSSYRGERGQVYYETRTVMRDGKSVQQRVQRVRWYPASMPKRFTDALEPWDLAEAL